MDTNIIQLMMNQRYQVTRIVGIYRPFKMLNGANKYDHFTSQAEQIRQFCSTNYNTLVIGDFNLDYGKSTVHNYSNRSLYDVWLDISYQLDLAQLVRDVTWSRIYDREARCSVLDHVYTNNRTIVN